jgi:hypothetical protein
MTRRESKNDNDDHDKPSSSLITKSQCSSRQQKWTSQMLPILELILYGHPTVIIKEILSYSYEPMEIFHVSRSRDSVSCCQIHQIIDDEMAKSDILIPDLIVPHKITLIGHHLLILFRKPVLEVFGDTLSGTMIRSPELFMKKYNMITREWSISTLCLPEKLLDIQPIVVGTRMCSISSSQGRISNCDYSSYALCAYDIKSDKWMMARKHVNNYVQYPSFAMPTCSSACCITVDSRIYMFQTTPHNDQHLLIFDVIQNDGNNDTTNNNDDPDIDDISSDTSSSKTLFRLRPALPINYANGAEHCVGHHNWCFRIDDDHIILLKSSRSTARFYACEYKISTNILTRLPWSLPKKKYTTHYGVWYDPVMKCIYAICRIANDDNPIYKCRLEYMNMVSDDLSSDSGWELIGCVPSFRTPFTFSH